MSSYPHMCRSDHVEIGHSDSEHEQCPLCRVICMLQLLIEENDEFERSLPQDWEGDPMHDACEAAKGVLASVGQRGTAA